MPNRSTWAQYALFAVAGPRARCDEGARSQTIIGFVTKPALDIEQLTSEERLKLIEQLWDSLDENDLPLTEAQRNELDRRLDDLDREGPNGMHWEQVRNDLTLPPSNASRHPD